MDKYYQQICKCKNKNCNSKKWYIKVDDKTGEVTYFHITEKPRPCQISAARLFEDWEYGMYECFSEPPFAPLMVE